MTPVSSDDDNDDDDNHLVKTKAARPNQKTYLTYITYCLYFLFWATCYVIAIELKFGTVYFLFSALFAVYFNTRTGPKHQNEISAYSVFNKDCHSIDGTLNAEQFEREIRYGPTGVKWMGVIRYDSLLCELRWVANVMTYSRNKNGSDASLCIEFVFRSSVDVHVRWKLYSLDKFSISFKRKCYDDIPL